MSVTLCCMQCEWKHWTMNYLKIKCAVNTEHETEMNEQIHFYRLWYTQSYTKLYIMYVIYILRSKIIDKFYL